MSFLKKIFGKKEGGSFFGNILRAGSSIATGGLLGQGANKIEFGQKATNAEILKDPTKAIGDYVSPLTGQQISFAGQPATKSADGTYNMSQPLPGVSVQSLQGSSNALDRLADSLGSFAGKVVGKATKNATVGADNKTLMVVGGVGVLLVIALLAKK